MKIKNKKQVNAFDLMSTDEIEYVNYIRFRPCRDEYYGVPYESVQEVMSNTTLTKVPYAPDCISGVINYRGNLLAIIDLMKFFQIKKTGSSQQKYIIVTKHKDISVGILAENIEEADRYDIQEIQKTAGETNFRGLINPKYILGLHDGITTILNIEAIFTDLQAL